MKFVQHPRYEGPRRQLRRALDAHRPGHMVFLIGPSGVGKTTVRRSVMQEMFGKPECWGRGRTPVIEAFAMLPNSAYFSSRDLARTLLDELHAPTLDWLLNNSSLSEDVKGAMRAQVAECARTWDQLRPKRATEGEYWGMVKRSLGARGCKYVSLDQVTALLVNHRDTSPADHTLHLMALAEASGVMFVMTGVHQATRLWEVHSELRRRVDTVWMPPYSDKRAEDRLPFLRLLTFLELRYRTAEGMLVGMSYEILAATGGVFAQIVQLMERASAVAADAGSAAIKRSHVESAYYTGVDIEAIWRDVKAFEEAMRAGDVRKRSDLARTRWSAVGKPSSVET